MYPTTPRLLRQKLIGRFKAYMSSTHVWSIFVQCRDSKKVHQLPQPWNVSRADPFIFENENEIYILFEEFNVFARKGYLVIGKYNIETMELTNLKMMSNMLHHVSFPHIFMNGDGEVYLTPETGQADAVKLYQVNTSTFDMIEIKNLLEFKAADPITFFHNNIWYLFVSHFCEDDQSYCNNLNLYYSTDLTKSAFVPHPMNPIKQGKYGSRMAGPLRNEGGELIRSAQDCRKHYGHQVIEWSIECLTPTTYRETYKTTLSPANGYFARHTHVVSDSIIVFDQKKIHNDWRIKLRLILKIPSKIYKLLK
ncbi:hypothetical protein N8Z59_03665 [Planktomarina temperata]|nr:hypothetical protein [Planktomarina temperata]